jgi:hypothetical protein
MDHRELVVHRVQLVLKDLWDHQEQEDQLGSQDPKAPKDHKALVVHKEQEGHQALLEFRALADLLELTALME